ncbi:MAG: hypothetical protein ACMV16_03800 [Macromonas sp.]
MSLSLPAMVATLNQFPDMAGGIFVFPKKPTIIPVTGLTIFDLHQPVFLFLQQADVGGV